MGVCFMKNKISNSLPRGRYTVGKQTIEERAVELAQYIIDSKDTVRGAVKKFGIAKAQYIRK